MKQGQFALVPIEVVMDRRLTLEHLSAKEDAAVAAVQSFADKNKDAILFLWGQIDGDGGAIVDIIARHLGIPREWERPRFYANRKEKISAELRRMVFERDAYRCMHCGGYRDLSADHIVPESKGGPTTFDNLQTLCRSCNSKKGSKV